MVGCVSTSVMPLTANTARVMVECSMCSATDIQRHGFYHAAATTIHCGFDEFVIESIARGQRGSAGAGVYEEIPHEVFTITMYESAAGPTDGSSFDARDHSGGRCRTIPQGGGALLTARMGHTTRTTCGASAPKNSTYVAVRHYQGMPSSQKNVILVGNGT